MTQQFTAANDDPNSVRKVIQVEAPQDVAWRVFTEKMGTWWPLAHYNIGKANAVDAVLEPRVGVRRRRHGLDHRARDPAGVRRTGGCHRCRRDA